MTASNSTPGDGHECDDSIESTDSDPFGQWARRDLAVRLTTKATDTPNTAREIADSLESGEPVEPSTVRRLRNNQSELSRLLQAALIASPDVDRPDREELAGEVHSHATDAHSAALSLDKKLQNDEPITEHDTVMVREWAEKLIEATDEVARYYQTGDM